MTLGSTAATPQPTGRPVAVLPVRQYPVATTVIALPEDCVPRAGAGAATVATVAAGAAWVSCAAFASAAWAAAWRREIALASVAARAASRPMYADRSARTEASVRASAPAGPSAARR